MGVTWIIGIFIVKVEALLPLAYIYTILVSFQGLFIFLIIVVSSKQVREEYTKWWRARIRKSSVLRRYFGGRELSSVHLLASLNLPSYLSLPFSFTHSFAPFSFFLLLLLHLCFLPHSPPLPSLPSLPPLFSPFFSFSPLSSPLPLLSPSPLSLTTYSSCTGVHSNGQAGQMVPKSNMKNGIETRGNSKELESNSESQHPRVLLVEHETEMVSW